MIRRKYKKGDWVIYRMTKYSTSPGPRATRIGPAPHGDDYSYQVEKFWVVADTSDDNKVLLRTRRGKEHLLDAADSNLRHAHWWERWLYRHRFPELPQSGDAAAESVGQRAQSP